MRGWRRAGWLRVQGPDRAGGLRLGHGEGDGHGPGGAAPRPEGTVWLLARGGGGELRRVGRSHPNRSHPKGVTERAEQAFRRLIASVSLQVSQLEEPSVLSGTRAAPTAWPHLASPGPSSVPLREQPVGFSPSAPCPWASPGTFPFPQPAQRAPKHGHRLRAVSLLLDRTVE